MSKTVAVGRETIDSRDMMHANALPNGKFTLSRGDGQVLSMQPDGTRQWRPAGTAGPYEQCSIEGDKAIYRYTWDGVGRYHIILIDADPPSEAV